MNKVLTFLIGCSFYITISNAQVKIGSIGTPNTNAVLELDGGTNKGLLLPKLNSSQIIALTTAPDGLFIYNTTDGFIYIRKSGTWQKISDATTSTSGLTLPYTGSAATLAGLNVFKIQNTSAGNAISAEALGGGYGVYGYSNSDAGGYFTSVSGPSLLTGNGNVGIANFNPTFPLDVNGRIRLRNIAGFTAGIWFDKVNTPNTQSSFLGSVNDSILGIWNATGGGNKFFFNHVNNNFGIYNSNPRAPLSFQSAIGNKIDLFYTSDVSRYGIGIQGALMQLYSGSATDDIAFGYGSSTAFTEKMRIKGNGNVGIGVTNPGSKLEIVQASSSNAVSVNQTGSGFSVLAQNNNATATVLALNAGTGPSLITIGKVGINNTDPSFNLDVDGRMRLRNESASITAGFWLDGTTDATRSFVGTFNNNTMGLYGAGSGWSFLMDVNDGAIMIGTAQKAAGYKVNVGGKIIAEELRVSLRANWPDYVFEKNYTLPSFEALEKYIQTNKHLPNIPAAAEVEKNGIAVGEMQIKLMEKIEELTLYMLQLKKENDALKLRIDDLKKDNHHP